MFLNYFKFTIVWVESKQQVWSFVTSKKQIPGCRKLIRGNACERKLGKSQSWLGSPSDWDVDLTTMKKRGKGVRLTGRLSMQGVVLKFGKADDGEPLARSCVSGILQRPGVGLNITATKRPWLEGATENCGLCTNTVMDFRAQQRGPLIYYTSAPAGDWKGAFYDCEGGSIAN